MRADRLIACTALIAAMAVIPAVARGQAASDLPPVAVIDDSTIAACRLQGTAGHGEVCDGDTSCTGSNHLVDLLSYLSTKTRPTSPAAAATPPAAPPATPTCDASKAPKDQKQIADAFQCFDDEFESSSKCLRVAMLDSQYANVLTPDERSLAGDGIPAAMQHGVLDQHCSAATTLCLDRNGAPIGAEKTLQKGDKLKVIVLSVYADDVGSASASVVGIKMTDLLSTSKPSDNKDGKGGPIRAYVLAAAISDPIGDDVHTVRVLFRRDDQIHGRTIQPSPIDLPIERGRFYVDFGLALPFVILGNRVVTSPALVEQTTAPRVSFSALVFLAGRRKDEIRIRGGSAFGIQIGTDFDFTRSVDQKDYYVGAAWEPIAGFGIDAGVALVRGQFIPPTSGPPDQAYMARPYIGVFLTPDFVTSARAAVTALEAK